MNIGIDIGEHKTVVGNSQSNGTVVFDELSFRTIKTLVELTVPRRIGNHVGEPMYMTIDKRYHSFSRAFNTAHYTFLKYLIGLGNGCSSVTVTVPYSMGMEEREKLGDFIACMGIRAHVMTDIAAAGFLYGIKYEKAQGLEKYALMDLGHSKTTFGIFAREKDQIKIVEIEYVDVGGRDIDKCLIDFLMHKYNLKDTVIREKLRLKIEKVKSNLNDLAECRFSIDVKGDAMHFDLTREEYKICIADIIPKFNAFFEKIRGKWSDAVQVIGGNRFNSLVIDLLKDWSLSIEMNAGECVAIGAALSGAVCKFGSSLPLKLKDIVRDEIYVKIIGNGEEKTVLGISKNDLIPTTQYKLSLKKKDNFKAEFIACDKVIKTLEVSEISGEMELRFSINSLGRLTTEATNCASKQSQFTFHDVIDEEKKMIEGEEAITKVGEMRNELESAFSSLQMEQFTEEEQNLINEARRDVLFASMSDSIDGELSFRAQISKKIEFLKTHTEKNLIKSKGEIDEKIRIADEFLKGNKEFFVPSMYKLQGLIYKSKKMFEGIETDIFGNVRLGEINWKWTVDEIENLVKIGKEEVERKKKEKEEKEEKEKRENDEKIKKENNKNDKIEENNKKGENNENNEKVENDKNPENNKNAENDGANETAETKS